MAESNTNFISAINENFDEKIDVSVDTFYMSLRTSILLLLLVG
jgi:hypothetical protein